MRLVDMDVVLEYMDAHGISKFEITRELIEKLNNIDAVPVARCEDCKWRNWETNGCNRNPCVEPWFENDFCSYGERKDNEVHENG